MNKGSPECKGSVVLRSGGLGTRRQGFHTSLHPEPDPLV